MIPEKFTVVDPPEIESFTADDPIGNTVTLKWDWVVDSDPPTKLTLRYQKEGEDAEEPVVVTGKTSHTFSDLEPGDYIFTLFAVNAAAPDPGVSFTTEEGSTTLGGQPAENEAPNFGEAAPYTFQLEENRPGRPDPVVVGTVQADDPNEDDKLTYAIISESELFKIDSASGVVSYVGPGEDHESASKSYVLDGHRHRRLRAIVVGPQPR